MKQSEIFEKLEPIFKDIFKNKDLKLEMKFSINDLNNWDSLHHVLLIDRIEKTFNIQFDLDDMLSMNSVENICQFVYLKMK